MKKYCSRLATLRLPLSKDRQLYVVNVHYPDSGQTQKSRDEFQARFEKALQGVRRNETMIVMGDFNASMGVGTSEEDEVCGDYGLTHVNKAGRLLKNTACAYELQDLTSHHEQPFYGTWVHPRSKKWHQLDRVFMKKSDRHMVKKCVNAEMVTDSDHYSVRLSLIMDRPKRMVKTTRQHRSNKDIQGHFGRQMTDETRLRSVNKVKKEYEHNIQHEEDDYKRIKAAVEIVIEKLPTKEKVKSGWCDLNFSYIANAVEERNAASRAHANTKTTEAKETLTKTRKLLKKLKVKAKNEWMLKEISISNESVLPGRGDRKSEKSMWRLAQRLQNGLDKWRTWSDSNVRDDKGEMAKTPEDNATTFQNFFNKLFSNDEDGVEGKEAYKEMNYKTVDVDEWGKPKMWELTKAIQNMKHTAPGLSGITADVWQSLYMDETMKKCMLRIMRKCWSEERVPSDWTTFHMCVLPKKGDLSNVSNYRGISMAETMSKLYSSLLKRRLESYYESIAPEYCNGFRAGRGRNDSIYTLKELLRRRKAKGLQSYGIYYDFIKCFDTILRTNIWESMKVMGVQDKMINAVKSTLLNTRCLMQVSGIQKEVRMTEGSGQGTTLGPLLCNFFFLPLLKDFEDKMKTVKPTATTSKEMGEISFNSFTHSFADDTCMITGSLEDAEVVAKGFNTYMKSFKSRVHVATNENKMSKSIVVHYPANENDTLTTDKLWVNNEKTEWINFEKGSPYLGSRIQANLKDDDEIRGRIKKASQMFGKLRKHLLGSKDTWREVKRKVLVGMILPMLLDGAEHWIVSANMMRELLSAYHIMIRGCARMSTFTTRKYRITTEEVLKMMGMEPLQFYIDWKILGYAGHVQRMKNTRHPKMMRDATIAGKGRVGAPPKTHKTQLSESLKRKGIPENEWKVLAMTKDIWRTLIKGPSIMSTKTTRVKETYETNPTELIGRHVEKKFGHKYHTGTIASYDTDEDTNDIIWKVIFDDSDNEDYNVVEMKKILCDAEDDHLYCV